MAIASSRLRSSWQLRSRHALRAARSRSRRWEFMISARCVPPSLPGHRRRRLKIKPSPRPCEAPSTNSELKLIARIKIESPKVHCALTQLEIAYARHSPDQRRVIGILSQHKQMSYNCNVPFPFILKLRNIRSHLSPRSQYSSKNS